MADEDDDVIPIGIPPLPGKPEAQAKIVAAFQAIADAVDDEEQTASIVFTTGLHMAMAMGIDRGWILKAVERELWPAGKDVPRPRRPLPGQRRRIRWH